MNRALGRNGGSDGGINRAQTINTLIVGHSNQTPSDPPKGSGKSSYNKSGNCADSPVVLIEEFSDLPEKDKHHIVSGALFFFKIIFMAIIIIFIL